MLALAAGAAWLVIRASGTSTTEARATAPTVVPIDARVEAEGVSGAPGAWLAHRESPGTYELSFPEAMRLDIERWDKAAGVVVRPVTDTTWLVRFTADDVMVDTGFEFRAAPIGS